MIDNLHLFLRVSDVLWLLIDELERQDSITVVKKLSGEFDVTKYKHYKGFEDFVRSIGIMDYRFYIGKSSRLLKVRSLTGPEKLKLLSNISIQSLLPSNPPSDCSRIQVLWNELLEINSYLSKSEDTYINRCWRIRHTGSRVGSKVHRCVPHQKRDTLHSRNSQSCERIHKITRLHH